MKYLARVIVLAIAALWSTTPLTAQTVRVGTFDKTSIVVAFYRSTAWSETIKGKRAEQEEAKKRNDTKKVEELEHWGSSAQELAHKQLAGEAPIANILEALQPAFPEVAAKAHVVLITSDPAYADKAVHTIDVTDLLLDWLKADEQTRKVIQELRQAKKPLVLH